MIRKLRIKLTLMYTCSTGFILVLVLILTMMVSNQQLLQNKRDAFQNNYLTVTQKLLMDNEISHSWLAEMEIKNHLIIHIEDNGQALWYKGSWKPVTNRQTLIHKVKKLAEKNDIDTNTRPISISKVQSDIYNMKGDEKDKYFGEVIIVPTETGYRSIIMLQYISENKATTVRNRLFVVFLGFWGITALYFVSRWMVGKSLKPVEESRRRQVEFVAAASHELKSPLAVIRANSSALRIEPERAEHFVNGIDKECSRLAGLIEDMLILASADAKNWKVKKEIMDMDILLIDTYETFRPFCKENHKDLVLDIQEEMFPKLEGDALRIKQTLAILIDNAVSYSKEGDIIVLRAYIKKNHLFIEVEDHGSGIDVSIKNEVFERFYKGDRSRSDKNHFGLGLSIAKELVELHNGKIFIKDTQGGGATFIISLPCV